MWRRVVLGLMAVLLLIAAAPCAAQAQRQCDHWSFASANGTTLPTAFVDGVPGKRIYICGYQLGAKSSALDFQLFSGFGDDCADEQTAISNVITLPTGSTVVNRTPYVMEYTEPGHSLCAATTGSGTLGATVYWTQF